MKKFEICEQVFKAMGDDVSRKMYRNRIDYSNGSNEAMESMILSLGGVKI